MLQPEDHVQVDSDEFGVIVMRYNPAAVGFIADLWAVKMEESGNTFYIEASRLNLVCPFDGREVDSDWRACPECREII